MTKQAEEVYFEINRLEGGVAAAAVRGSGMVLASQGLGLASRMICSLLMARLLSPGDFGLFAMVVAVTSALLIFKDLGLCDAIIQCPSINHQQISTLFWINLAVSVGI